MKLWREAKAVLVDTLSAKMRLKTHADEKSTLINLVLPSEFQSTEQGKVVADHLHLCPFGVTSDRKLVPIPLLLNEHANGDQLLGRFNAFSQSSLSNSILRFLSALSTSPSFPQADPTLLSTLHDSFADVTEVEPSPDGLEDLVVAALNGTGQFEDVALRELSQTLHTCLESLPSLKPLQPPPASPNLEPAVSETANQPTGGNEGDGGSGRKRLRSGKKQKNDPVRESSEKGDDDGDDDGGGSQENLESDDDEEEEDEDEDGDEEDDREAPKKRKTKAQTSSKKRPRVSPTPQIVDMAFFDDFNLDDDPSEPSTAPAETRLQDKIARITNQQGPLSWIALQQFRYSGQFPKYGREITMTTRDFGDCVNSFDTWFDTRSNFTSDFTRPLPLPTATDPVTSALTAHIHARVAALRLLAQAAPAFEFWAQVATCVKLEDS